jgi:hypothetical protein
VDLLLSSPVGLTSVEQETTVGSRAVHFAASLNVKDALALLLSTGKADPNALSPSGSALHWAAGRLFCV